MPLRRLCNLPHLQCTPSPPQVPARTNPAKIHPLAIRTKLHEMQKELRGKADTASAVTRAESLAGLEELHRLVDGKASASELQRALEGKVGPLSAPRPPPGSPLRHNLLRAYPQRAFPCCSVLFSPHPSHFQPHQLPYPGPPPLCFRVLSPSIPAVALPCPPWLQTRLCPFSPARFASLLATPLELFFLSFLSPPFPCRRTSHGRRMQLI